MKRFFSFLLVFFLTLIQVSAFYDISVTSESDEPHYYLGSEEISLDQYLEYLSLNDSEVNEMQSDSFDLDSSFVPDSDLISSSYLGSSVLAVLPSGFMPSDSASDLKSLLTSIFGEYQPLQELVTVYLDDGSYIEGYQVVRGISGVDWVFLSGVFLFSIVLYAFLRLIGVILHV